MCVYLTFYQVIYRTLYVTLFTVYYYFSVYDQNNMYYV